MEPGRLRRGEWLVAAASVALLAVTFLPWYGADLPESNVRGVADVTATAWQAHTIVDVVLALLAGLGLGLAALTALRRAPAAPVAASVLTTAAALLLLPVLVLRVLFPPGPNELIEPRYGALLGLLCVAAIAAGAWKAMGDERTDAIEPPFVPAQPPPPEVAPAGSVVAEGREPGPGDLRD